MKLVFVEEKLLKVQEILKLKLLKFYYKLCNNPIPPYFDSYRDVIDREPPRALRHHFIHKKKYIKFFFVWFLFILCLYKIFSGRQRCENVT